MGQRLVPVLMTLSLLFLVVMPAWAADPEIDRLLQSPVGKDWVTNGGNRYTGGSQAAPIGSPMSGTFTAIDSKTNKIAWQHKTPYRVGGGWLDRHGRWPRLPWRV
jgi:hypothetical protein